MSRTSNATTVEEYLNEQPNEIQELLSCIRSIIKEEVPEAKEVISYRMPAYKHHGMLIGYAAFKNHCSLFMWKKDSINHFLEDLKNYSISESTIRFSVDQPFPDELVRRIVRYRKEENEKKT